MGLIKILSEEVAAAISAGEVVERPLSVVKELVENAVDAGANRIEIFIENGGKSFIEIRDNGAGMDKEDMGKCLLKYATSKIASRDDLFAIKTMGFRGEALFSISQVSKLKMISKKKNAVAAYKLEAGSGNIGEVVECGASDGTSIEVKELFYNIPARKKFLKSTNWERTLITEYIEQMSILYPAITFILKSDGRDSLVLKNAANTADRIHQLFPALDKKLMHADMVQDGYRGHSFISLPDIDMASFSLFAVNGRVVKDKVFHRVVNDIFAEQRKKSPFIFLTFHLPEEEVDVNVHPAKREIKFQNTDKVYRFLRMLMEQTVTGNATLSAPSYQVHEPAGMYTPGTKSRTYSPVAELFSQSSMLDLPHEDFRIIGSFAKGFLIIEKAQTLYIIDQHAVHERFIFNRLMDSFDKNELQTQKVLPYVFTVNQSSRGFLETQREAFERLSFYYEEVGPNSYALTAIPAFLSYDTGVSVFSELLGEREITKSLKDLAMKVMAMAACKEAVKKGDHLSREEIDFAINAFLSKKMEQYCPHGRNFIVSITLEELERRFGRKD
jgi:DNA mismatch repair protein MutL